MCFLFDDPHRSSRPPGNAKATPESARVVDDGEGQPPQYHTECVAHLLRGVQAQKNDDEPCVTARSVDRLDGPDRKRKQRKTYNNN